MIRKRSTRSKNASRASTRWWSAAPRARARAARSAAASASRPPVSTVTVTTGRPSVSLSQGMQKEVSSPPEKARRIGSVMGHLVSRRRRRCRKRFCSRGAGGGDEDGVVARHRADDLRPGGAVERRGHRLRRADRGDDHRQVRPGGLGAAQEGGEAVELRVARPAPSAGGGR